MLDKQKQKQKILIKCKILIVKSVKDIFFVNSNLTYWLVIRITHLMLFNFFNVVNALVLLMFFSRLVIRAYFAIAWRNTSNS